MLEIIMTIILFILIAILTILIKIWGNNYLQLGKILICFEFFLERKYNITIRKEDK